MKNPFLSHFTPSLMSHQVLEDIFVQREALAKRIVTQIRDSILTPAKHYNLLIGPRGIGKTHLVALAYYRVQAMDDLDEKVRIAWMREEEWGVTSFLDLLLRIFRALQAEYPKELPPEKVEALYDLSAEAAEHAAAQLLKEYVGEHTLLLLVENLDDLFEGLGDKGQKRLRAFLQENPVCTIVATAQCLFNGVSRQTSPFYGFFQIHHLQGLEIDGVTHLLTKIAKMKNDEALATFIQTPTGRARIRAVHHLAGGNHRVYVIFSQFLNRDSLDELVQPFMNMLDELTPYYQARMTWLSPQQRKIVEFLCDRRGAAPVKDIARHGFMTHQTASSQLQSLREMGYVNSQTVGRESYYELREPLMRLCIEVKKKRGEPIGLFVDFLRFWYSKEELESQLGVLAPDAALERQYVIHALRMIDTQGEDPRITACVKDYHLYFEQDDFVRALTVAEELVQIRGKACDWHAQGYCFAMLERRQEELAAFKKVVELEPDRPSAWYNQALALLAMEQYDESLISFDTALELAPQDAKTWFYRNFALGSLGLWEEALASIDKSLNSNPNSVLYWETHGIVLSIICHWDRALISLDRAILLGSQSVAIFFNRAEALLSLQHWQEGIAALETAFLQSSIRNEQETGSTHIIVQSLLKADQETDAWHSRIADIVRLYRKYNALSALAEGLTATIPALRTDRDTEIISQERLELWLNIWRKVGGNFAELQLPLRLLDAAVRFSETQDQRVLLELPIEERKLLQELMEEEPSQN